MRLGCWVLLPLLLAAGWGRAAEVEHVRGDFRFSVAPEPAFVQPHEVPARWDPAAPGHDEPRWRHWLYDVQSDRRQGRDIVYVDQVFEPRATSELGEAGRFQISFSPEYQRLTLHRVELRRDGTWLDRLAPERITLARRESRFEEDLADGEVTALIVLDDVRVGDVIRVRYSISGSNPILAGQVGDWALLGWRNPLLDARLRVLDDPGTRLRVHRENTTVEPTMRQTVEGVEVRLHAHGVPAIQDEDDYPNWYQPFPRAQVAVDRSWAEVVAWALPLYPEVAALPPELEARLAQWRRLEDPIQRVKAALRTVQDEVRYFGIEMGASTHRPAPPETTWNRRYGDCKDKTYLLVTLLRRLGVKAVPALVSHARGRAIRDFVPSASVFDHVIVRAEAGGTVLWLDPTITHQGGDPRDIDPGDYGVALPVAAGTGELEALVPARAADHGIRSTERLQAAPDGKATLAIETVYRGRAADTARRTFANERREDISRRYADYYRKRYGDLEVTALPVLEDDREANVLTMREQYLLKAPFESESGGIRAIDVFGEALDSVSALPPRMERRGPLAFGHRAQYRHEVELRAPEQWTATFRGGSEQHVAPAFAYNRDLKIVDGAVKLVYELQVRQDEVEPAQVAEHLSELRQVRESLWARLRFHIPAELDRRERDRRLRALLEDVIAEGEAK